MKHKSFILLSALTIKVVYLIIAIIILNNTIHYNDFSTFIGDIFFRWDTRKYYSLVMNGYPHSNPELLVEKDHIWAFFPLYPGIIYTLMKLFSISFNTSAFIWSIFSSITAFIGIYLFCIHYFKDSNKSLFITLFFICLPFSFYFSGFLTESTFYFY